MQFVSFAQNYEDVMLWRALKNVEHGFYIDVGAAWPDEHSVTKAFYDRGWTGINVEPNPKFFSGLREARPSDVNLNCAVSSSGGQVELYLIQDTGLSTIVPSVASEHEASGWVAEKVTVEGRSLASIWREYVPNGQDVHFLKIDAEGAELDVLEGNDWAVHRPWIVLVEATKPLSTLESAEEWEYVLLEAGYKLVYSDGLNRFYLEPDRLSLEKIFTYPPNVFDNFILAECVELKWNADQAREGMAAAQKRGEELLACFDELKVTHEELKVFHEELKVSHEALKVSHEELLTLLRERDSLLGRIEQSLSWWITAPLRKLNPKRFVRLLLTHARLWIQCRPRLKFLILRSLNKFGLLRRWAVAAGLIGDSSGTDQEFTYIKIREQIIAFSNAPLQDRRGIGRVSRSLLSCLESMGERVDPASWSMADERLPTVYFYSTIHWCPENLPTPSVVMIHDVIPLLFPEIFPDVSKEWECRYKKIAAQATRIVTISITSSRDIERYLGVNSDKIDVIYNGVERLVSDSLTGSAIALPSKPYVVFFGSHDFHKNIDVVLRAFRDSRLDSFKLLMLGDNNHCRGRVVELGLEDRVQFMGRLSDEDAAVVLKNAVALLFPSLYEGFGLPPFEAALLGTPTICSAKPAMTELLEDAAIFVDPHSERDWVEAVLSIQRDEVASRVLGNAKKIADRLSWEASSEKLLMTLSSVHFEEPELGQVI